MSDVSEKQKKLLILFRAFSNACDEYKIDYSLACGSALGAVREKGIIPWDEDIDVMMRISDYNKLDLIAKEVTTFSWVSSNSEKDSPVVLARVYESNVDFNNLDKYSYIDIHVYCGCPDDKFKIMRTINKADFLAKVYWVKKRKYHNIFKRKKSFIGVLCKIPLLIISNSHCVKTIIKYTKKWPYAESHMVMPIQGYYKMKEVLPREWLDKYIVMEFSGVNAKILSEGAL